MIPSVPKVSVVMPVYNTAAYVAEAVRSITGQTLRDLELIVVDDGSTDGSPEILAGLAGADQRIKVITQSNAGQSAARNRALRQTRGEYVYFMDSDDRLDEDTLELCCAKCDAAGLDLVIFDADVLSEVQGFSHTFDYGRAGKLEDKVYTGIELLEALFAVKRYSASPCLNLVRREHLERNRIRFYPGIIHEDELYTVHLYIPAMRAGRIDRRFFHRRLRPSSVMTSACSPRTVEGYMTVAEQLKIYMRGKSPEARRAIRLSIRYVLGGVMSKAASMPAADRFRLLCAVLAKYPCLVKPGNALGLAVPWLKRLKRSIIS